MRIVTEARLLSLGDAIQVLFSSQQEAVADDDGGGVDRLVEPGGCQLLQLVAVFEDYRRPLAIDDVDPPGDDDRGGVELPQVGDAGAVEE